jgi:transposase
MEEYDSMEYKSTKAFTFGYNIWKHSVKENLLEYFTNKIEFFDDIDNLLQDNEFINCELFNNKTINSYSIIYNNSYKFYDYDEKEFLITLENDNTIYHLYLF